MIKESLHGNTNWRYHYTDDRAGAYFDPERLCCVTSVDELLGPPEVRCAPLALAIHTGPTPSLFALIDTTVALLLPGGLDSGGGSTPELAFRVGSIKMAQVRNYLNSLRPKTKRRFMWRSSLLALDPERLPLCLMLLLITIHFDAEAACAVEGSA